MGKKREMNATEQKQIEDELAYVQQSISENVPDVMHAVGLAIGELIKAGVIAGDAEAVKRLHRATVTAWCDKPGPQGIEMLTPGHPLPLINGVLRAIDPKQPMWDDAIEEWAAASYKDDE